MNPVVYDNQQKKCLAVNNHSSVVCGMLPSNGHCTVTYLEVAAWQLVTMPHCSLLVAIRTTIYSFSTAVLMTSVTGLVFLPLVLYLTEITLLLLPP
jgi:hypothetical protein